MYHIFVRVENLVTYSVIYPIKEQIILFLEKKKIYYSVVENTKQEIVIKFISNFTASTIQAYYTCTSLVAIFLYFWVC